jgi:hypothetical protein
MSNAVWSKAIKTPMVIKVGNILAGRRAIQGSFINKRKEPANIISKSAVALFATYRSHPVMARTSRQTSALVLGLAYGAAKVVAPGACVLEASRYSQEK